MKAVKAGMLKCIGSIRSAYRWTMAHAIDIALPYQFLRNQLKDCGTAKGQLTCITCRDAILDRISLGRVTVAGVFDVIAEYESTQVNKLKTAEEVREELTTLLYDAVYEARRGYIHDLDIHDYSRFIRKMDDSGTSVYREFLLDSKEGRYHMVLRKGKELGLKLANKVVTVILPAALVVGGIAYVVSGWNEFVHKTAAYEVGTEQIVTWGPYYDHGNVDGPKSEPMCSKCQETVGTYDNPAHGHELITASNGELVRSCPLD